ncbi:exported hypothetical protein [Vibrio nigripulchritudo SOn1]|uniref:Tetratricopeptide repeat protein n=1 Tax=Vibrio nigripulchritudo SOn1 TaxID=1238450 RepID=A0AAV2VP49_9VIBR|nr:hypothetical protein [Vibrio nigripulchritudo]CCO46444.1 exported hypothetical protein [Vibrio nigripulchritudo SOn1]
MRVSFVVALTIAALTLMNQGLANADLKTKKEELDTLLSKASEDKKISSQEYLMLEQAYQSTIRDYPDSYIGYDGLSTLALFREDCVQAIEYSKQALRIQPNILSYFTLLNCYNSQQDYLKAASAADSAYSLNSNIANNTRYLIASSHAYTGIGKYDVSKNLLAMALKVNPEIKKNESFLQAGRRLSEAVHQSQNVSYKVSAKEQLLSRMASSCEEEVHASVDKAIEVKGFSYQSNKDNGLWREAIFEKQFKFVELCVGNDSRSSEDLATGCWRISSQSKDVGVCSSQINKKYSSWEGYKDFYQTRCLTVSETISPSAKYGFWADEVPILDMGGHGKITRHTQLIKNGVGNILSRDIRFLFYKPNKMTGRLSNNRCAGSGGSWDWHSLLFEQLVPTTD